MTYEEALHYLGTCISFGIKPGLERIEALLEELGNPERAYKTVHVTGTNGKGSVTSYIAHSLFMSGIRVGRFTSPHLERYTERIRINDRDITEEAFGELIGRVALAAEAIIAKGVEAPTEFEILTAAAFLFFKEQEVRYAVVEVGLGGLLDSTNVITPEVSVITNVAIDHQAYCGETIEDIAKHKAGIIKPGVPVVTAAQGGALKLIREKAHSKKCRIYTFGKDFMISSRSAMKTGQMVTVDEGDKNKAMLFTTMVGLHQAVNIACAYMALKVLMKKEGDISEETIREGLARTTWPGRFELLKVKERTVILDGAHNESGAEAFAISYKELFKDAPKTMVFAILQDKALSAMVTHLVGAKDKMLCVPAPTPRSTDPLTVASKMPCFAEAQVSVEEGVKRAFELTTEGGIIVVCGSLYILGEARAALASLQH